MSGGTGQSISQNSHKVPEATPEDSACGQTQDGVAVSALCLSIAPRHF